MNFKSFIKRKKSASKEEENENKDNAQVEENRLNEQKAAKSKDAKKKVKRYVAISLALASTLAAGVFAGGLGYTNHLNNEELSSQDDIKAIATALNYDTSYATTTGLFAAHHPRFRNNGDKEPIYVSFDKNMNEENKDVAVKSLDYIFNFLSYANDNYQYRIVDSKDTAAANKTGKATIVFSGEQSENNVVKTEGGENKAYSYLVSNPTINQITIPYHDGNNDLREEYTKDLMFGLGFKNVDSNITEAHQNTIMGSKSSTYIPGTSSYITPNDFAGILSLYSPRFESGEQRQEYIEQSAQTLNEYSVQYYDKILSRSAEELFFGNKDVTINRNGNFKANDKIEYSYSETNEKGDIFIHSVTCDGGNYRYTISRAAKQDFTGNLNPKVVFEGNGKTVTTSNGVVVLEDVNLPCEFDTCTALLNSGDTYGRTKHTNFVLGERDGAPYLEQVDYNSLSGRYNKGGDNKLFNQNGKLVVNGTLVNGHTTSREN